MKTQQLESLVINVQGRTISDPLKQSEETLRLALEVTKELANATEKCRLISEIDGHPVSIVGLKLIGRDSVETIGITYISDGERLTRDYAKQDFYEL
ncbi:hypothetical protein HYX12_03845 [Candidatus Woesearchaeota archaeon]|nr:hypothetical protein [Candidatus Woesearchaeota archaeon]